MRGDQFQQADDRRVAGFETEYRRNLQTTIPTEITVGFQNRYDDIDVGLYSPTDWLLLDADISFTKARLHGVGANNRIGNAVERTASMGMIVDDLNNWSGGIRLRYLGDAPLTEARLPRSESTFLMNAQTTFQFTSGLSVSLELMNVLDSDDRDITYFYESQLPGEAAPVEDIHFHSVEPRSMRVSIQARF